jgi:hypothetical protein
MKEAWKRSRRNEEAYESGAISGYRACGWLYK